MTFLHHYCLAVSTEWLLKNHNCPYCRQTCLPMDTFAETNKRKIKALLLARQHRDIPCFYCVEHGIVRPPSHLLLSWHKRQKMTARSDSDNENRNDTTGNRGTVVPPQCEEEASFLEKLHARSHESYCRTALQRLRGNTMDCDDEDERTADLENQAAMSLSSASDDEADHRETFIDLH